MKALLSLADVKGAIDQLKAQGRKVTLANLHAQLGHRGSMTTLVRLKAEAEMPNGNQVQEHPEALEAFREIWAQAVEVGRAEMRAEITAHEEVKQALLVEAERLESELVTRQNEIAALTAQRDELLREITRERQARDDDRRALDEARATITEMREQNSRPLLFPVSRWQTVEAHR